MQIVNEDYSYTLIRHYYGLPDYLDTYMDDEEDCFCFKTEEEANQCLKWLNNGDYFNDEKYGKIRYYVYKRY